MTIAASAPSASKWRSFCARRVSAKGGASGRKKREGCGSKVATIAGRARPAHRSPDHGLVADMDAVEIADRNRATAQRVAGDCPVAQHLHGKGR
jgi:hypothetical protein